MTTTMTRARRTEEQRIADLEAKIAEIRARAERQKVKKDPALRHITAALRSIDKAMSESGDATTRKALDEARGTLNACLSLNGVIASNGSASKRRTQSASVDSDVLLAHVRKNPGQRGEHIAAAMSTDVNTMRPVMKRLIGAGQVKTKGERRGMTYFGV